MKHTRIATARIDGVSRDKDGYLICDARFSKVGVFEYKTQDGKTIREYRPSSEVFSKQSLNSYIGAAVTRKHPRCFVTPANHRLLSVGTVISAKDSDPYVAGKIKITDATTADEIEQGKWAEISMGYYSELAPESGPTYDRVQREITINHAALLPRGEGRLGSDVSLLRLDSADNIITEQEIPMTTEITEETVEETVTEEKTDAVEETIEETPEVVVEETVAETKEDAVEETPEEVVEETVTEETVTEEKTDALEAVVSKLDEILSRLAPKAEEKTDSVDELVEARVAQTLRVRTAHAQLCPEARQDGRSDTELCVEGLKAVDAEFDASKHEDSALVGLIEIAAKTSVKRTDTKLSFAQQLRGTSTNTEKKTGSFAERLRGRA